MTYQWVPISRRSFLSGATAAVAGGVFLGKSDPVRADSDPTGDEQWTQLGGNAASTHSAMTGVGPTGDIFYRVGRAQERPWIHGGFKRGGRRRNGVRLGHWSGRA